MIYMLTSGGMKDDDEEEEEISNIHKAYHLNLNVCLI